jgi:hypothetical protein
VATTAFETRWNVVELVVGGQETTGTQSRHLSRSETILSPSRQSLDGRGTRGSGGCRRSQGGPALYVRAPREHLPRQRAQPSRPSIDRDVPCSSARDLRAVLASPQVRKYDEQHAEPLSSHEGFRTSAAELRLRRNEAINFVVRGARLRDVAGAMGIPMALRHIEPGVAHLATEVLCRHPELLRAMPDTVPSSRIWLCVVPWAHHRVSADFAEWAARQVPQIPGSLNHVGGVLGDIADWVRAGMPPDSLLGERPMQAGREFVVRPFAPSMSLKTAMTLSADWHEAVANNLDGPNSAFPDPWYPAARLGDYEILPIEDAASLYREGTAMHHCVGTYGDPVQRGDLYIYSIRRNGERVATLALGRHNGSAYLTQIRGPCNTDPQKPIVATVQRWLCAQKPLPPQGSSHG